MVTQRANHALNSACSEDFFIGEDRMRVDGRILFKYDTCGRGNFWMWKEKVEDSKLSGYEWTAAYLDWRHLRYLFSVVA